MHKKHPTSVRSRALSATALGALVAACLTVSACGSSSNTSGSGKKSAKGVKVALVLHLRNPFTKQIQEGAEVAAKEFGASLIVTGPQNFDAPTEITDMNNAVSAGAKGVAVVAQGDTFKQPLNRLNRQGVPVVQLNVYTPSDVKTFVGISGKEDYYALGQELAKRLGSKSGDVYVGTCAPGLEVLERRYQAVKQAIEQGDPNATVQKEFNSTGDISTNYQAWSQQVHAHPNAIAYVDTCSAALGNLYLIKKRNPQIKAVTGGAELDPNTDKGIESGLADATVAQNAFLQGYLPIRLLLEHIVNKKPLPEGWITSGYTVVTKKNIKQFERVSSDPAYARRFYSKQINQIFADPSKAAKPINALHD